eukprot:CAMPEP_0196576328 /NCGR_PEP_ID=MMETSP1081-20130531/5623_1 /TAXON_ID=36882 /ORGANISM="Pyramimonas amylifera, Strain CCMP720" /LENGTH=162 /DNA_ID=CAMNT_0041894911 /DNA_START=77 /DNA_END=565 /DNA_ORIENTATION=-
MHASLVPMNEDAEKRARRQQRFKEEETTWLSKENIGSRIAWSGGEISSNKEEALQRFLQRKSEKGETVDAKLVNAALNSVTKSPKTREMRNEAGALSQANAATSQSSATEEETIRNFTRLHVSQPAPPEPQGDQQQSKAGKKNAKRAEKRAQKKTLQFGLNS